MHHRCAPYRVRRLCLATPDGLGVVSRLGPAVGVPQRQRDLGCFSSPPAAARLLLGAHIVSCSISGRFRWWLQRLFLLERCGASSSARIPSNVILTFVGRSNVVRRPSARSRRAVSRETGRRSSTSTSRKATRLGPACHRSPVRRCTCVRLRLLAPAEHALLDRAQDRPRVIFRLWSRSRRLRTSRACNAHEHVRLVAAG